MFKISIPGLLLVAALCNSSCQSTTDAKTSATTNAKDTSSNLKTETELIQSPTDKIASAATILARPQVPILCYHQIRDWKAKDSKAAKDYIVPIDQFKAHLKMLADSGYHTILPDQLYNYLNNGAKLPSKPIMLTFDDTDLDQFTVAAPEMKKYGFKGVFFIMTVSLGRPNYMSKAQVKELSDDGHVIGSHTWDHHNVKKYQGEDWVTQIEKPTKTLKEITGKDIKYFAYPFGLWNPQAIPELKKRGFIGAFILAEKRDENDPLFTIRRIIASGYWSPKTLHTSIIRSF
ncbi:polysaccharide deacetylase family protein [Daejeonella oryzae]|uniref:polysaccharide deacetylase family protein n=1 Tax=Daejeonella oryzae TaxID=1122943 RepID=UPI0004021652|nr:polysaccharide deacetylase family protein [Daejeonella oryzae]